MLIPQFDNIIIEAIRTFPGQYQAVNFTRIEFYDDSIMFFESESWYLTYHNDTNKWFLYDWLSDLIGVEIT